MYAEIDKDIDNEEFRTAFETQINCHHQILDRELPTALDREVRGFRNETAEVIERCQAHVAELLEVYSKLRDSRLEGSFILDLKIDSGLKLNNLLSLLVGGAMLAWNPGGWIVMALAVAGLLIRLSKALYKFFSSDYKKGQQRKAVNKNLLDIAAQLREIFRKGFDSVFPQFEGKIEDLQDAIREPVAQVVAINKALNSSVVSLTKLCDNIQTAGTR
jgi:hypothetical protein